MPDDDSQALWAGVAGLTPLGPLRVGSVSLTFRSPADDLCLALGQALGAEVLYDVEHDNGAIRLRARFPDHNGEVHVLVPPVLWRLQPQELAQRLAPEIMALHRARLEPERPHRSLWDYLTADD